MELAPLALFVYNRPDYTQLALDSILRCNLSQATCLMIFSDGPKNTDESHELVQRVRAIIRNEKRFKSIEIIEHERNIGLSRSVISGVTRVCEEFGKAIVLEDDFYPAPDFLEFMNAALKKFCDHEKVYQIGAYIYPIEGVKQDAFFMPLTTSRGWATWNRAWKFFCPDAQAAVKKLEKNWLLKRKFNLNNSYSFFKMLKEKAEGKNDSWAILWRWSVFARKGLVLYPRIPLIYMGGFDGSGTNCTSTQETQKQTLESIQNPAFPEGFALPEKVSIHHLAFSKTKKWLRHSQRMNITYRIKRKLTKIFILNKES